MSLMKHLRVVVVGKRIPEDKNLMREKGIDGPRHR